MTMPYILFFGSPNPKLKTLKMPSFTRPLFTTTFKNACEYAKEEYNYSDDEQDLGCVFSMFPKQLKVLDLKNDAHCKQLEEKHVIPLGVTEYFKGTSFYSLCMQLLNEYIFVDEDDPWLKTSGGRYFTNTASKISMYDIASYGTTEIEIRMFFKNLKTANLGINCIREYGDVQAANGLEQTDDSWTLLDKNCIESVIATSFPCDKRQCKQNGIWEKLTKIDIYNPNAKKQILLLSQELQALKRRKI